MIVLHERNEGDVRRFEEGLKRAKHGLSEAYEIWEDMKEQLAERGDYSRYSHRDHYDERGYYRHDDWDGMPERRGRDSMGRYR